MRNQSRRLGLAAVLLVTAAAAPCFAAAGGVPLTLTHSGYLLNGSDSPLDGSVTFVVRLKGDENFAAADAELHWEATCSAAVVRGYYTLVLGTGACAGTAVGSPPDAVLDTNDLPVGAPRYLGLSVNGIWLSPGIRVGRPAVAQGTADLVTLGTVTTGTWHASAIDDAYIASAARWDAADSALADEIVTARDSALALANDYTETALEAFQDGAFATLASNVSTLENAVNNAPRASETAAGVVEEATAAQVAARVDTGETGARLYVPPSKLPEAVPLGAAFPTYSTLDGTPKAVGLLSGGSALSFGWSSGDFHTAASGSNKFVGFASATTTRSGHQLLNHTTQGNGATYNAPAGVDRYLLVYIDNSHGTQTGHNVTGVTFAGTALTNLASLGTTGIIGGVDSGGLYIYGMALGTSASVTSGAITATFNGAGAATIQAHTLGNVDQTTPVAHTYAQGHASTTNPSMTRGGMFFGTELEAYGTYGGQNVEGFVDTVGALQHTSITAPGKVIQCFKNSGSNWYGWVVMVALRPSRPSASAFVQMSGTVKGFSGLTPGALYYLSGTTGGGVSTLPIGEPIAVATSADALYLLPR